MINCTWSYHACVQYKWQPSALVGADILTQNRTSRKRRSRKRVLPAQAGEAAEVIVEGAEGEAVAAACAVLDGEGGQMRVGGGRTGVRQRSSNSRMVRLSITPAE
jgi:hypothetical protein